MTRRRSANVAIISITTTALTSGTSAIVIIGVIVIALMHLGIFVVSDFDFLGKFIKITARTDIGQEDLARLILIDVHITSVCRHGNSG